MTYSFICQLITFWTQSKLTRTMCDIKKWMDRKQLKLYESKTECLIIGKKYDIRRLNGQQCFKIIGNNLNVSHQVKNLGVIMDKYLSFDDQINDVTRIARYRLRNIAFVSKYLDRNPVKLLVHSYVISRLDYCNSLYFNLPKYQLKKLQSIMNRAARLIRIMPRYERITPVLIDLH